MRPHYRCAQALFKSTVQLVLLPTVVGLLANEWFKKQVGQGRGGEFCMWAARLSAWWLCVEMCVLGLLGQPVLLEAGGAVGWDGLFVCVRCV